MKPHFIGGVFSLIILFWLFGQPSSHVEKYSKEEINSATTTATATTLMTEEASSTMIQVSEEKKVTHIIAPKELKAVYMSSWVASTPSTRNRLVTVIDETELNAVVIDVKDNTGIITWAGRMKQADLVSFIEELHAKNIYVIGRIASFQDPRYALLHKDHAVQRKDGSIWKSRKGEAWVDTGSRQMWKNIALTGIEAYALGFDEINLDYIRFSTEGTKDGLVFPQSGARAVSDRVGVVNDFYEYITEEFHKKGIPVSGDVFGIITTSSADIPVLGQDLHKALQYFDYVAPMVYPSHYAPGTFGYTNPSANPGAVIREAMKGAITIADEVASSAGQATSTVRDKLRPWYQDFDMGAVYTAELVRAQIDEGRKLGIISWMLWDPSNKYTRAALKVDDR
jgi:hypothetical protein